MHIVESCWTGTSTYPIGLGETIGPDSYCFYSSLTSQHDSTVSNYNNVFSPVCYKVACDYIAGTYSVTVGNISIDCPRMGGAVFKTGFNGKLLCPDFNLICTKTVECGGVLDCIMKKSLPVDPVYDYLAFNSVQTINTSANIIKYSLLFIILFIVTVMD